MSNDRLTHLANLLETGDDLPPATAEWLRQSLRRWRYGLNLDQAFELSQSNARGERDRLLREHANEIEATGPTQRATLLAGEVRKLHSGRTTRYTWLRQADSLRRLPETPRQLFNILR
jgi:hypothetical protein